MSQHGGKPGDHAPRLSARAPFPDDAVPLYTVGQVADMLGVQAAFLRRLDTLNVVSPSRSAGGQRRYTRLEIEGIHAVTELIGEGFTVAGGTAHPGAASRGRRPPPTARSTSG